MRTDWWLLLIICLEKKGLVNVTIKVLCMSEEWQVTELYSAYLADATEDDPITKGTIAVLDGKLVLVDKEGELSIITELHGADKVLVSTGGYGRIVWPAHCVKP